MPAKTKVCTKCGKTKLLGEYHAYKRREGGKRPTCKKCRYAAKRAWIASNREHVRAYDRERGARRRQDPEYRKRHAALAAAWYEANREAHLLHCALYKDINGGF